MNNTNGERERPGVRRAKAPLTTNDVRVDFVTVSVSR